MQKFGKKNRIVKSLLVGALMLFGGACLASENVIYVINNNSPSYNGGNSGYGGNIMCTVNGGICVNDNYMLSTSRARYLAPQWRKQTIRERKLSEANQNRVYYR